MECVEICSFYLAMLPKSPASGPSIYIDCTSVASTTWQFFPNNFAENIRNFGTVKSVQTPAMNFSFNIQCAWMALCSAGLREWPLFFIGKPWNAPKPAVARKIGIKLKWDFVRIQIHADWDKLTCRHPSKQDSPLAVGFGFWAVEFGLWKYTQRRHACCSKIPRAKQCFCPKVP